MPISTTSRGLVAAGLAAACLALAVPAHAESEFGLRYWYGFGETGKNLYDTTGSELLSRLTYRGLNTNSAELTYRVGEGGLFVKGYLGWGASDTGSLQDEDFPPITSPYSSTDSQQHNGKVSYGTFDLGHYFFGNNHARFGAFVGYNFFNQKVSAYGCTQTATSPDICVPTIDSSVLGITQDNKWTSIRIGATGDTEVGRLRLSGDAAVVYSTLNGTDAHWLRIGPDPGDFTGPVPETGNGWGYQLEANVDYRVTQTIVVGVGARLWHLASKGEAHFEDHVNGFTTAPQKEDWYTNMWGLTAHVAWRF